MAFSTFIQNIDRLSVKSVMRGSTSTICGVAGTIAVIVLCLAIYIPPTMDYFKGDYFESQFFNQQIVKGQFYSNKDFKIAIQFRARANNTVANHSAILQWGRSQFYELLADYSANFYQPSHNCRSDYFAGSVNPVLLEDCFLFPENSLFSVFWDYGYYTPYTNIFYWLWPKASLDPFANPSSHNILGNFQMMDALLRDYYYIVYFTSKIVDGKTGAESFQVNRFYSTENDFSESQGASYDLIIYNQKKWHMDISIMPWWNNVTTSGLVWLGQAQKLYQLDQIEADVWGIEVDFSLNKFNVASYRYYRKLDWLLGVIGGAMLLFYIILWVPCNFINKNFHQITNVNQLLLINHGPSDQAITQQNITAANVTLWYWLSNPITNFFFSSIRSANHLVKAAQYELDIVRLVKKLKVTERSLKKKEMWVQFKPKVLQMKTIKIDVEMQGKRNQVDEDFDQEPNENMSIESDLLVDEEIVEEDFVQLPVDNTFGLTEPQTNALTEQPRLKAVYENNMTANVLLGETQQTIKLKDIESKSKVRARYTSRRKKTYAAARKIGNALSSFAEWFDFFGVRPNLNADPHGSSFVGLCATFIIVALSILTVALTLQNANKPQIMIDTNYQEKGQFQYVLQTGNNLKFALCISYNSALKGTNRKANLRFYTDNKQTGRSYYDPVSLTRADYDLFDLDPNTVPINLNYCYSFPPQVKVPMAKQQRNVGYFGFLLQPYCSSTLSFCQSNAALVNENFLTFINTTLVYLFLPQNRFDANSTKFINNLVFTPLNINYRYMKSTSAFEETLFIDQVRILDDTQNWFVRKQPIIKYNGLSSNQNTLYPLSRNIPGKPYYDVKIQPSMNQINYIVSTPKSDKILGIIGGVFVIWYAIFHWLGKLYNSFKVRAKLAEQIYDQESINESPLNKFLTIIPWPNCLLPSCFNIRNDVMRMRQLEKKIKNDLNYLWLVKHVDTVFTLSSALFQRLQAKNLSLVFVKQKLDENQTVQFKQEVVEQVGDDDFLGYDDIQNDDSKGLQKSYNKVVDESFIPQSSSENVTSGMNTQYLQKFAITRKMIKQQNGPDQLFSDNYIHGLPKHPRFNWFDTYEYPASLTINGKRQATSTCGGICCLLLLMFILIIGTFEASVYLNKDDARIGMSTMMMQPSDSTENSTFNNQIHLTTGKNFKLAVTFSSAYEDYPHNISNWTNSAVGIVIYQEIFTLEGGKYNARTIEIPMVPCPSNYLLSWLSPVANPAYYPNSNYGYCVPDGITLQIDGIPGDPVSKRFTLSIFNKLKTNAGNMELKKFMQTYLPKFHFSNPTLDPIRHQFDYYMTFITMDAFNVTYPVSQNISLQKVVVLYDDQILLEGDPYQDISYAFTQFQQFQTSYYDTVNSNMTYNLSFANSYLVRYYTFQNQKFFSSFGIIGGLVALFIFGFGCCVRSFNSYNMKYLIGKELYSFDFLKKKQIRNAARGRRHKSKEQINLLSDMNNMHEGQVFLAYLLSFPAKIISDYNFNPTLRRVTLIQSRVQEDIDLFKVYKNLHLMRDILNQQFSYSSTPLASAYLKHIYNPEPETASLVNQPKILAFAKKHNWSAFEQFAVFDAATSGVNLKAVFDNAFLQRQLNMMNLDRTSIHLSQFGGTQGSIGTNSVGQQSQMHREEEEIPDEA